MPRGGTDQATFVALTMGFVMGALASREEKLMNEGGGKRPARLVSAVTQFCANNAAKISYRTNAAEKPRKGH
jgi:hypothetical protein